ncbi:MAG: glycoside hydrolase family 2 TIM barrel-domain containing protein, partial [Candidatus Ornithospirochaeta sp.]
DKKGKTFISDVFVKTESLDSLEAEATIDGNEGDYTLSYSITEKCGNTIREGSTTSTILKESALPVSPWSPESPVLYTLNINLRKGDEILDTYSTVFGFRTVEFRGKDFYLNGKKYFFRGLNRHQSWPYIGYAAPERMQREDARILKYELGVNAVRTSHYPQSQYFVDECDRIGLLVFTEIPGWQHIGDERWKERAIENTRDMVLQYRNHPSVFMWGVRINESLDDDAFYTRTNEIARALDPTRPTSGVRFIENSSLLEDAYGYNDFSHTGNNPGVKNRKKVLKDSEKPLFVSEANGHMFPTKSFDNWERRQEQALRHARVLNASMEDGGHAGCMEWCMFDYATHKDFGSGDRICYHGVMDSFRNPKDAAFLYASQSDEGEVIHVSSSMDIGDYNGGIRGKVWIFTNADSVKIYKNGREITELSSSPFSSLPHGPIPLSDTIGNLLETEEGFSRKKAKIVKECLNAAVEYGFQNLPFRYILKLGWCMVRHGLKYSDGVALFSKYVSQWGGESTEWRFTGVWKGKEGKSVIIRPEERVKLEVVASTDTLFENDGYDETLIRLRATDNNGNTLPYALLPVTVESEGSVETIGPKVTVLEGGMGGVIVKTNGRLGKGKVILTMNGEKRIVEFDVEEKR